MIALKEIDLRKEVSKVTGINAKSVESVLELVQEGGTIPFIARYRKEKTGGLDEVQIAEIIDTSEKIESLDKRKRAVLKSLEETGNYNDELGYLIQDAADMKTVEDIYAPYKPGRKTKADKAIDAGLLPLSELIISQNPPFERIEMLAGNYLCDPFPTIEDVITGAEDIITQKIADDLKIKDFLRKQLKNGFVISKIKRGKKEEGTLYLDYHDFSEKANKIVPHRIMAINRGEKEGFLNISIEPEIAEDYLTEDIVKLFFGRESNFFFGCGEKALKMLTKSLGTELFNDLKEWAIEESLKIFHKNLEQIVMAPPFGEKAVIAIDPGIRTGCKTVLLDSFGNFIDSTVLNLHIKSSDAQKIRQWIDKYEVKGIAVGNGTFGRESFEIMRNEYGKKLTVALVNEDGASIYSASEIAREEFPDLDLTVRGAISIGRRFQDPMAELVKITPESLGVGQYQHDIPIKMLCEKLKRTVEWTVNRVGANLNTAGPYLLAYVSGLDIKKSLEIVKHRKEKGRFNELEELKKIKGIGAKSFEQCSGFLRIFGGREILDSTGVHPESYKNVKKAATICKKPLEEFVRDNTIINNYIDMLEFLADSVIEELRKKGLDPRDKFEETGFSDSVRTIDDLTEGIVLNGIIDNIVAFGAFVDIGIKEKGLVHISEISDQFIKNVSDHLSLGQKVKVVVKEIDPARKRISLSMKL
jgi:protein Tex